MPLILQLFFQREGGVLVLIFAKLFHDIFVAGTEAAHRKFQSYLQTAYKHGTFTHMPVEFLFFGLHLTQNKNAELTFAGDEKLSSIQPGTISLISRNDTDEQLNAL